MSPKFRRIFTITQRRGPASQAHFFRYVKSPKAATVRAVSASFLKAARSTAESEKLIRSLRKWTRCPQGVVEELGYRARLDDRYGSAV